MKGNRHSYTFSKAEEVRLTGRERAELEQIVRRHTSPQLLAIRAKMILKMGDGTKQ